MRPSMFDSYASPPLPVPQRSFVIVVAAAMSWAVLIGLFFGAIQLVAFAIAAVQGVAL